MHERLDIASRVVDEIKEILAILKSKAPDAVNAAMRYTNKVHAIDIIIEAILDAEDEARTPHFAGAYATMREAVREGECGYNLDNDDDIERDS